MSVLFCDVYQVGLSFVVSPLINIHNETGFSLELQFQRPEPMEDEFASVLLTPGDSIDDSVAMFDATNLSGGVKRAIMSLSVGILFHLLALLLIAINFHFTQLFSYMLLTTFFLKSQKCYATHYYSCASQPHLSVIILLFIYCYITILMPSIYNILILPYNILEYLLRLLPYFFMQYWKQFKYFGSAYKKKYFGSIIKIMKKLTKMLHTEFKLGGYSGEKHQQLYRTATRPAILFGSECWALT